MPSPRLARWIVARLVPEPQREYLLGDLDEQYAAHLSTSSSEARRRFWSQALRSVWQVRSTARRRLEIQGLPASRRSYEMGNFIRDIRLGARTALRSPGYSVIAVITLALAIGANTLLFSIANPLVIRSLPLKDQSRLAWVLEDNGPSDVTRGRSSMADFLEWRQTATSFSAMGAYSSGSGTLSGNGDAEHVQLFKVTANLCDVWGLHPTTGRLFQAGEDAPGHALVGILSYRFWQKSFHGDPNVLGRTVLLNGAQLTIVGVMEQEIEVYGYAAYDMWTPLMLDRSLPRDQRAIRVVGRLAPGATLASAGTEMHLLAANQARDHADTNLNWEPRIMSATSAVTGPETWIILGLLAVVVVFVLLIACANLANLVMARVLARRLDFAVRQALGASRLQLIRPLIVESTLLGLIGGACGLGLADAGLHVIRAIASDELLKTLSIDTNVLMFTAALSIVTPILFSLWPALGAGRAGTAETLRDARSRGGRKASRRRNILVGSQVALALSLLVLSGLIVQTMLAYAHVQTGMDVPRLLTAQLELPSEQFRDDASRARFAVETAAALGATPGVTAAAVISHLPVFDAEITKTLSGTMHDGVGKDDKPWASWFAASPAFFRASGVSLLTGRGFADADLLGNQPVALLNRMAAERYFDHVNDALGRTITVHGDGDRTVTIVGVVADTRDSELTRTSPQIYLPFAQSPTAKMTLIIRSDRPDAAVPDIRATMRRVQPTVAIANPKPMTAFIDEDTANNDVVTGLFIGFGILALALASAGLYGVISYSVGQRQREIGVRLALGATPASIRTMVLRDGMKITGIGMIVGLVLAIVLAYASASVLFGVSPYDPKTFGSVIALVSLVAIAAVWAPAIRAMRVDPARSLRAQ